MLHCQDLSKRIVCVRNLSARQGLATRGEDAKIELALRLELQHSNVRKYKLRIFQWNQVVHEYSEPK